MAVKWSTDEEGKELAKTVLKPVDHAEFAKMVADKRWTYYVSTPGRLGFLTLSSLIEYRIFHPNVGPESNDDFRFCVIRMSDIPFSVFSVPCRFDHRVTEFAEAILMRVVKAYPILMSKDGPIYFPGHREGEKDPYNLYSIENGTGSQIYLNRQDINAGIRAREGKLTELLMRYGYQVPLELVRDYLWGLDTKGQTPS